MMLSGYAFQEYVEWETKSVQEVLGTLIDHGIKVNAVFYFDKEGKFSHMETNDRYYSEGKGDFYKKPYVVRVHSYQKSNGYLIPKNVSASWILEDGTFEYYKGVLERIVHHPKI